MKDYNGVDRTRMGKCVETWDHWKIFLSSRLWKEAVFTFLISCASKKYITYKLIIFQARRALVKNKKLKSVDLHITDLQSTVKNTYLNKPQKFLSFLRISHSAPTCCCLKHSRTEHAWVRQHTKYFRVSRGYRSRGFVVGLMAELR